MMRDYREELKRVGLQIEKLRYDESISPPYKLYTNPFAKSDRNLDELVMQRYPDVIIMRREESSG